MKRLEGPGNRNKFSFQSFWQQMVEELTQTRTTDECEINYTKQPVWWYLLKCFDLNKIILFEQLGELSCKNFLCLYNWIYIKLERSLAKICWDNKERERVRKMSLFRDCKRYVPVFSNHYPYYHNLPIISRHFRIEIIDCFAPR